MAEINAQLVKDLRERTGAGMMECKKALVEANGDLAEAEVVLRKRNLAAATKKETRSTKQGLIGSFIAAGSQVGVLVEVNCESDFVARTEEFQTLTSDIAAHVAETKPTHLRIEAVTEAERVNIKAHALLYEQPIAKHDNITVGDLVKAKIAKLGENISVSRFVIFEVSGSGVIGSYIHTGSQIGVLVEVKTTSTATADKAEFKSLVHDIAMQVAAASPQVVDRSEVAPELLAKEKDIQRARVIAEGKPEKMADRIVEGRLAKFYEEVCLTEQPFIKENSVTVAELLKSVGSKVGDSITVVRFVRFKVGDAGDVTGVEASPLPVTE